MVVIFSSQSGLRQLEERDGYKCAKCGITGEELRQQADADKYWNRHLYRLEVDHIVPLALAPRELRYWMLENMQLLCHDCHVKKTTGDFGNIESVRETGGLFDVG